MLIKPYFNWHWRWWWRRTVVRRRHKIQGVIVELWNFAQVFFRQFKLFLKKIKNPPTFTPISHTIKIRKMPYCNTLNILLNVCIHECYTVINIFWKNFEIWPTITNPPYNHNIKTAIFLKYFRYNLEIWYYCNLYII